MQSVLEGDALESPIPSPQHGTHTLQNDMHTRLEMYASRLAQVEGGTRTNSTPDSDDEHHLIAQYCQSLPPSATTKARSGGNASGAPKSPVQVMVALEAEQREELESMIKELEEENANLQAEYEKLKAKKLSTPITTPDEGCKTPTSVTSTAASLPSTGGSVNHLSSLNHISYPLFLYHLLFILIAISGYDNRGQTFTPTQRSVRG